MTTVLFLSGVALLALLLLWLMLEMLRALNDDDPFLRATGDKRVHPPQVGPGARGSGIGSDGSQ